ncbi:ClC family H(+)/Cl(-) exchange transporter [Lentilactobacillus laojiaonis]|uniref:ClC family H(+)/Cl(-) exchange transporter n=1 Tax=Lentilactobacillus laojiaonis TaxID=2883998 RepID=UPI001D0ACA91|nr:ClC family H(+)/Cl(-) exchange transporter [Lentilactobacillus laojiaonis]UDM32684.1 ClC family H(+)/Cl(-) exchange transporter [Lentilactobacillus laojiaonis]
MHGIVIGGITGAVISIFRKLIEILLKLTTLFYIKSNSNFNYMLVILLINLMIWLVVSQMIKKNLHIMGSGIPEIKGILLNKLKLNWLSTLVNKFIASVLVLGTGVFLGREGPTVQLGGMIGQGYGEITHNSNQDIRYLIKGGAAAGISAAFNAPIAATIFGLEEFGYSSLAWMTSFSAAITSDLVAMKVFGLKPVLYAAKNHSLPLKFYWYVVLMGVIIGLLAFLFQKNLLIMPNIYQKLFKFIPRNYQGIVPLALIIPIGYFWTNALGGSSSLIVSLYKIPLTIVSLVILLVLRYAFTMLAYGSGLPGGIFLPMLTLGAIIGALYGVCMVNLGLLPLKYLIDFIIFGMVGYFSGISKTPFTAILLITEMVGSVQHLVPLGLVALTSYLIVDLLGGKPIYDSMMNNMLKTA